MPTETLSPDERSNIIPYSPEDAPKPVGPQTLAPEERKNIYTPKNLMSPVAPVTSGSEAMKLGAESASQAKINKMKKDQEIYAVMGGNYSPDANFDKPKGTFSSDLAQADLARSMDLSDKQRKWQSYYPQGDIVSIPLSNGEEVLLGREDKNKPFKTLSKGAEIAGVVLSEPMVGGIAGSFLPGLWGPVGTAAGTALGSQVQRLIETARGYGTNQPTVGQSLAEGTFAGIIDATFRGMGRLLLGPVKTTTERSALRAAIKAADDLGLEPLGKGQIAGPVERGIYYQVGALSKFTREQLTKQQESLLKYFRGMSDDLLKEIPDDVLLQVNQAQQKELFTLFNFKALSRADAAETLQKGAQTWKRGSARLRDRLYDKAIQIAGHDVSFYLNPVKKLAEEINQGTPGWTQAGGVTNISEVPADKLKGVLNTILELHDHVSALDIIDTRTLTEGGVNLLGNDLGAGGRTVTAFEQIKTLRTRLWDLKQSDDPMIRRESSRLYKELTKVMESPISGNPEFVQAFQKANGFNRYRENMLEMTDIANLIATNNPEKLVARYFTSTTDTKTLENIKEIVPKGAWEKLRQGFQTSVAIMKPRAGLNTLEKFLTKSPDSLNMLVKPEEMRALTNFLSEKVRFSTSPAFNVMKKDMSAAEQFTNLVLKSTKGEIDRILRIPGAPTSDIKRLAKAAIYKDILDFSSSVNSSSQEVLDAGAAFNRIQFWKNSGKLDSIFSPGDWRLFEHLDKYMAPLSQGGDVGGAFVAGQFRQEFITLPGDVAMGQFKRIPALAHKWTANNIAGWLLSRPASFTRIHRGSKIPFSALADAIAIERQQYDKQKYETPSDYENAWKWLMSVGGEIWKGKNELLQGSQSPETTTPPVYHKGGLIEPDYSKLSANLDKISDLQREKHLRTMYKKNPDLFHGLMDHLENR